MQVSAVRVPHANSLLAVYGSPDFSDVDVNSVIGAPDWSQETELQSPQGLPSRMRVVAFVSLQLFPIQALAPLVQEGL